MTESINDKFNEFLLKVDADLVGKWEKFRSKQHRKNPFIFFREEMREIIKKEDASLSSREVTEECSKRWSNLKEQGGSEYEKYINLSKAYSVHGTNPEVSKPFHAFSLAKRASIVAENPDKTALQITDILIELWGAEDKEIWSLS
jgi:hypothetical protein